MDFNTAAEEDKLSETVNYEKLYAIAEAEIYKRSKLLEHIVYNINAKVKEQFPGIKAVHTTVCKFNPPIGGICKQVCVSDSIS